MKDWPALLESVMEPQTSQRNDYQFNQVHIGLALPPDQRGYYVYTIYSIEPIETIEWFEPPTMHGTILKASGRVPSESLGFILGGISATPTPSTGEDPFPCYQKPRIIAVFTDENLETMRSREAFSPYGGSPDPNNTQSTAEDYYRYDLRNYEKVTRVIDRRLIQCISERHISGIGYLIRTPTRLWQYQEGQETFDVEVDLAPILETYEPGAYFVEFSASYPDQKQPGEYLFQAAMYPIWLGVDPPENHLYQRP